MIGFLKTVTLMERYLKDNSIHTAHALVRFWLQAEVPRCADLRPVLRRRRPRPALAMSAHRSTPVNRKELGELPGLARNRKSRRNYLSRKAAKTLVRVNLVYASLPVLDEYNSEIFRAAKSCGSIFGTTLPP